MTEAAVKFSTFRFGEQISERFHIIRRIGRGGSGTVYLTNDASEPERLVALKTIHSHIVNDPFVRQRFQNEIHAAFHVSHPNVVRAYEYFVDGSHLAFSMEYVPGPDLAEILKDKSQLPADEVSAMLKQLCLGTAAIHRAGIVHRDLKPENILIHPDGTVKITDFGIALAEDTPGFTEKGQLIGTHEYVSPEYVLTSKADHRSDIYSLGILAFEMLTGSTPFADESLYRSLDKKVAGKYTPLKDYLPRISPALAEVIEKAIAVDPEERYQSAMDFYEALQSLSRLQDSGKKASIPKSSGSYRACCRRWKMAFTAAEVPLLQLPFPDRSNFLPALLEERQPVICGETSSF